MARYEPVYLCMNCSKKFRKRLNIGENFTLQENMAFFSSENATPALHHCSDDGSIVGLGKFVGFADADSIEADDGYED